MPPKRRQKDWKRETHKPKQVKKKSEPLGMTFVEKEQYEIRIKSLREKIKRRKELIEELIESNKSFQEQYENDAKDKTQIINLLNQTTEKQKKEIADFNENIFNLLNQHKRDLDRIEKETEKSKQKFEIESFEITEENIKYEEQLDSLENFKSNEKEIMCTVNNLENKLLEQKDKYNKDMNDLQQEARLEKNRLKRDVIKKVEEMGEEFCKHSRLLIPDNIIPAIEETIRIKSELNEIERTASCISEENTEMRKEENELRTKLKTNAEGIKATISKYQTVHLIINSLRNKYDFQCKLLESRRQLKMEYNKMVEVMEQYKKLTSEIQKKIVDNSEIEKELYNQNLEKKLMLTKQLENIMGLSAIIKSAGEIIKQGINYIQEDEEGIVEYLGERQIMLSQITELFDQAFKIK